MTREPAEVACFAGDTSDMSLAARRLAIKLKQGSPIVGGDGSHSFASLIQNRDEIEHSLNDDLLTLFVDEDNEVAWAQPPEGLDESCLLVASSLQRNDVNIFIALASALYQRRQAGYEKTRDWIVTREELFDSFVQLDPALKTDMRGERTAKRFENSIKQAVSYSWLIKKDESRFQITPVVCSLVEHGFGVLLAETLRGTNDGE